MVDGVIRARGVRCRVAESFDDVVECGELKNAVGGDLITITTPNAETAVRELQHGYGVAPVVTDGTVGFHVPEGEAFLPWFVRSFGQPLAAINLRRPTLDDVFLDLTGREIRDGEERVAVPTSGRR